MRISLLGLIRLTVVVGIMASTVALGVARLQPSHTRFRFLVPPHYGVINGFVLTEEHGAPGLLDPKTGALSQCPLPKGDVFDYGTCSPWQNESAEFQVVGRWMRLEGDGIGEHCVGMGLARYALPSGRVLNRCETDILPASHPCWFPGTAAKVLFAGTDGTLYRMDFQDSADESESDGDGDSIQPVPIPWRLRLPGSRVEIRDPVWPAEPRLGGRLIVSLTVEGATQNDWLPASRLWWLELSRDFTSIVAAGPLALDDSVKTTKANEDERFPNLANTPDGKLILSYLAKPQQSANGTLHAAYVTTTSLTDSVPGVVSGSPRIAPGTSRVLILNHRPELSPFSTDGRWIFGLVSDGGESLRVVRYSTALGANGDRPATE